MRKPLAIGLVVAVLAVGTGAGVYVYEIDHLGTAPLGPGWPCTRILIWPVGVKGGDEALSPQDGNGYTNIGESCRAVITGQLTVFSGTLVVYLFNTTQQNTSAFGSCVAHGSPPICPPNATTYDSGNITAGVFNVYIPITPAGAGYDIVIYNPSLTVTAYANTTQPFVVVPT